MSPLIGWLGKKQKDRRIFRRPKEVLRSLRASTQTPWAGQNMA